MSTSGQDETRYQTFLGPGSFGGDNRGVINNVLLDAKTKALVAKMTEYAPPLAGLLEKAVRDGVMSSDAIEALMFAARNINEDVAQALMTAGRNINEDVADKLWYAADNLNKNVVQKFTTAVNQDLTERVREINSATDSLKEVIGQASSRASTVPATAGTMATLFPRTRNKGWLISTMMAGSCGAGLVAAITLMLTHLERYAITAAILMVLIAVFSGVKNVRR